ncbi:pteridine-dependent deoxygenase [Coralloluteibacterium thermophilus]|uniref:Pteridine-dependent deoxygenase n=1 Tax=Coralloluteibacterium thermophilum TaxID=2707049 RepID=A0ABV9NET5_9GAMM
MSRPLGRTAPAPSALRVGYEDAAAEHLLADPRVLAVIGFAGTPARHADPRRLDVGLRPLAGPAPVEVWRSAGTVEVARHDGHAYAHDGRLAFVAFEVVEGEAGIGAAAREAYARLGAFLQGTPYRHPLRIWNYFDDITLGEGDDERYRHFCVGRAQGLGEVPRQFAAATGIGCQRPAGPDSVLQVYALCAREAGTAIENPRQVSAYRYPRQYGPQPPSFARAMHAAGLPLMLSGTASIVGHETVHAGDVAAQLGETLLNLDSLVQAAAAADPAHPPRLGAEAVLKAYVRHPETAPQIAGILAERLPQTPVLLLAADICRRDLLLEIDGFAA